MREVPHLVEMRDQYGPDGVLVVGVTQADSAAAEQFQIQRDAHYPILSAARPSFSSFGVKSVPVVFLKDPSGTIVAQGLEDVDAYLGTRFGS